MPDVAQVLFVDDSAIEIRLVTELLERFPVNLTLRGFPLQANSDSRLLLLGAKRHDSYVFNRSS